VARNPRISGQASTRCDRVEAALASEIAFDESAQLRLAWDQHGMLRHPPELDAREFLWPFRSALDAGIGQVRILHRYLIG
jgi:hypothetical protein